MNGLKSSQVIFLSLLNNEFLRTTDEADFHRFFCVNPCHLWFVFYKNRTRRLFLICWIKIVICVRFRILMLVELANFAVVMLFARMKY